MVFFLKINVIGIHGKFTALVRDVSISIVFKVMKYDLAVSIVVSKVFSSFSIRLIAIMVSL